MNILFFVKSKHVLNFYPAINISCMSEKHLGYLHKEGMSP